MILESTKGVVGLQANDIIIITHEKLILMFRPYGKKAGGGDELVLEKLLFDGFQSNENKIIRTDVHDDSFYPGSLELASFDLLYLFLQILGLDIRPMNLDEEVVRVIGEPGDVFWELIPYIG